MKISPELERITDKVLAYDPTKPVQSGPLKIIAGTPNSPLIIGDIEIPCYVLEDETRVLTQGGFLKAIGRSRTPKAGTGGVDNPPTFLASKNLYPFILKNLVLSTTPVPFRVPGHGPVAYGYRAELLPQVCEVYLKARDAGALLPSQRHIAKHAEVVMRGLATVGVIALVDEATGYQRIREERALATILERYIAKEFKSWTKTFPIEFYEEICRLKKWPSILAAKRPSVIGKYTNDFVYDRLAPGVLGELQRKNPVLSDIGRRRHKHHQWFTTDIGHPKLQQHLHGVMAIMRISNSWGSFKRNLKKAYPKPGETRVIPEDGD